ncbi:MAG: sigma-54-dependent Fis family transcriptional regulator, partial [Deltaproteobacteria bacterium]|nr:sigma-54-dependent Fis family transcriptional regulator [Deltaproteobacteria bacterium]
NDSIQVDVRVIAATNVNFQKMVREGKFREDLYYRLKVIEVRLPPLRERIEGIPLLANHFLKMFCKQLDKKIFTISDQAMECLTSYPWPGNVRELRHVMERASVLCGGSILLREHLPEEIEGIQDREKPVIQSTPQSSMQDDERSRSLPEDSRQMREDEKIIHALRITAGNKAKAAKLLGIARSTLYRQMQRYRIKN